jgi:hypothetical protein
MSDKTKTTELEMPNRPSDDDDLTVARELSKEWFDKFTKLKNAFDALVRCSFTKEYASGWLSPKCRYKIELSGDFGYKEIDSLIQKLEVDRETFKDIEWTKPVEERNV